MEYRGARGILSLWSLCKTFTATGGEAGTLFAKIRNPPPIGKGRMSSGRRKNAKTLNPLATAKVSEPLTSRSSQPHLSHIYT